MSGLAAYFSIASWSAVTWTAFGTWILVIGTLILLYWQTVQNQRLNSGNAILTLRERFDNPEMRRHRRKLARHLLDQSFEDLANMEVATFFELIGALTHRRVLDETLVWEAFGTWVTSYYSAMRKPHDLIGEVREKFQDPLIFHDLEWLNDRMARIDIHRLGRRHSESMLSDIEVHETLTRETQLEDD